jgi:hypothetical protein
LLVRVLASPARIGRRLRVPVAGAGAGPPGVGPARAAFCGCALLGGRRTLVFGEDCRGGGTDVVAPGSNAQRWSAAGAARCAREARAAAAGYLRRSSLAVEQIEFLLRTGMHVYHRTHGDARRALAQVLAGCGYEAPFPDDAMAAARMVAHDEAQRLSRAQLYVVSPDMADVVAAGARTLTGEDVDLLEADDLPSPTGCLVLPEVMWLRRVGDDLVSSRAVAWNVGTVGQLDPADGGIRPGTGVRVSGFYDTPSSTVTRLDLAAAERARREGVPLPPLLLEGIASQVFRSAALGDTAAAGECHRERMRAGMREFGELVNAAEARQLAGGPVVGEHTPGSVIDDPDFDFTARYLYAFWRLCEQKIATSEPAPVNHTARVLAHRTGTDPDVRIIRMRSQAGDPTGEHRRVNWHHRWVVQMHKVRQWYPAQQRHKIILRGPYVKGPADKPLLDGTVVRALVR